MQYRDLLKAGAPLGQLQQQVESLHRLLDTVREKLQAQASSRAATFVSAFVILLREGLEAILIVAGIAAFLAKVNRRDGLRYLHAGWIVALLCGIATWYIAAHVITISSANREVTEGVTALVSAAVLLYVGYWLHSKSYAEAWQQYIRTKLTDVLSSKTLGMLALLSFGAVYREMFETVLFYQALWVQVAPQGHAAVGLGFCTAAAVLVLLAWLIARWSIKLPLQLFFGISSAVIAVMAVIFVGKGIAALHEAGTLTAVPVHVPAFPMLGIYPNLEGLVLQAVVLCISIGAYAYSRYSLRRNAP
jgi:high-affinity iron transporter